MTKKKDDDADDIFGNFETPKWDDFPKLDADFFKTPELPNFDAIDPSVFAPVDDSLLNDLPTPDFPLDPDWETKPSEPLPPPDPTLTAEDAAKWMKEEVERTGRLDQEHAVWQVKGHFGERFTRQNENGNLAFTPEVLKEFRKMTEHTVVWCKRERYWRKRQPSDPPKRQVPC